MTTRPQTPRMFRILILLTLMASWVSKACQAKAVNDFRTSQMRHNIMNNYISQDLNVNDEEPVPVFRSFLSPNKYENCSKEVETQPGSVCQLDIDREAYEEFAREGFRQHILKQLGMKEAPGPNVSARQIPEHVRKHMIRKYRKPGHHRHESGIQNDQSQTFPTRLVTIVAKNASTADLPNSITDPALGGRKDVVFFDLAISQLAEANVWDRIISAKLFLYVPSAPEANDNDLWLDTYMGVYDKAGHVSWDRESVDRAEMLVDQAGWINLDLKKIVTIWLKNPSENQGLAFDAITKRGHKSIPVGKDSQHQDPHIILELEDTSIQRETRSLGKTCSKDAPKDHCCQWPLKIDFRQHYDWDWIIHPLTIEPNYCGGDCSLGKSMPANAYAHLLQQSGISPCCSPQAMEGVELVYMNNENTVIQGYLDKMIVKECGCG